MIPEQNHQLPPELEWEQMEAGILQKMEELEASSKTDRPFLISKNRLYVLVMEMMSIVLISLFFIWPTRNSKSYIAEETQHQLRSAQITSQGLQAERLSLPPINSTDSARAIHDKIQYVDGALFKNAAPDRQGKKLNDSPRPRKQKPEFLNKRESDVSLERSSISTANKKEGRSWKIRPIVVANHRAMYGAIGASTSNFQPNILPHTEQMPLAIESATQRKKKQSGRMVVLGGATFWSAGYGNTQPERASYESAIMSFQSQLNYIQPIRNDFIFMVGFQYQQLESRFHRVYNLDDYILTLRDTIVAIQTNAITGEQTEIRGDVELSVAAQRTVRHHNKAQLYQIPIAVGKTWHTRNWQADVLAGGTVNVLSQNNGRTLYQNELIFYEGSNVDFLKNQWKFNALLTGRLTYSLNEKTGITTGIQYQKSLMNWTSERNTQMRPTVLGVELGLTLSL